MVRSLIRTIPMLLATLFLVVAPVAAQVMIAVPVVLYYNSGACPTAIGGIQSLPQGGMFCWRTDTLQLYTWQNGAWSLLVTSPNGVLVSPTITGGSITGATITSSTLTNPTFQTGLGTTGLALVANPSSVQVLGNDLVIGTAPSTVAPAGPGQGAAGFRLRKSPITPGYCQVVVAAGNSFGQEMPLAFVNPAYGFLGTNAVGNKSTTPNLVNFVTTEIPGGPGGC